MKKMKKMATLVLSLVMLASLLPAGMTVSAETIEKQGFYMVNSSSTGGVPYVYTLPEIITSIKNLRTMDILDACIGYGSSFIDDIAAEMKDDFDSRPEGTRYFEFKVFRDALEALNESVVYWDKPVAATKKWLTEFLKEYKKIGGKLDGIIMDVEFEHVHGTYLYSWVYLPGVDPNKANQVRGGVPANKNIYKDIVNDPRYATEIRPMLVERGFKFWENPEGYTPNGNESEIWTINDGFSLNKWLKTDTYWRPWSNVMSIRMSEAVNEAVFEPLMKYYPDAILSDYQVADSKTWLKPLDQYASPSGFNSSKIGNTSNTNVYNYAVNNSVPVNKTPVGYNKAIFGVDPFNMTQWDVNAFKKMIAATDTGLVNAWVAGYNNIYGQEMKFSNVNTPYYTETMLHMGLLNMNPSFLGYVIPSEEGDNFQKSMKVISDILAELTRVAGASDRKPITTPISWNGEYILSGMYAGGRNIWRITPNTEVVSLSAFKVKNKAPTFSVDGVTITFPQGRIIADGDISEVGTCGYWVETPANVMPVITASDNRYANNPAYEENFEQYDIGTTLTANTASPEKLWEVSGSALKVQVNNSSKVLAMTGTATLKNVKVPKNVTAGDSYAKQQAWEVTFTLPSGLSSGAELCLLSCSDDDGGIKISGGKMYYDQGGTYKELSGVNLSAGTYTVKREMDFRNEDAYKCSYAIYGSNGSLIKEVKNVAMGDVTIPVTTIEIACKNVNGNIYIDDFKLYPTGVTTELSAYDAVVGTQLADVGQVRTKDTGYRFSWMNTTNQNMVAYVYNAKNNAVIAKVEMPAGQDGVFTGVVKASAGSAVQLAFRTENGAATTLPNYDNGDFSWPSMEQNFGKPVGGGSTDSTTPPTTDPTNPPATDPTDSPVTDATDPVDGTEVTDSTDGTETTDPADGTDTTVPDGTEQTTPNNTEPSGTQPGDTDTPDGEKGLTGGQIAAITTAGVVTAGGGAIALLYVFKKELVLMVVKKLILLFKK